MVADGGGSRDGGGGVLDGADSVPLASAQTVNGCVGSRLRRNDGGGDEFMTMRLMILEDATGDFVKTQQVTL